MSDQTTVGTSPAEDRALFTRGPIAKHLVAQSIPMVWGFLATFGFGIADGLFVAKLGTVPMAAVTLTAPITGLIYGLTFGIGIGVASVVSRGIGSGEINKVQRAVVDSLLLGTVIVLILMVVGLLTIDPLFRFIGGNDATMPYVHDYMKVWYWGVITVVVPFMSMSAIRASGDMKAASRILIYSSLANVVLDPLFIFGWGPIPRMEVQGAAIATVLAQFLAFGVAAYLLRHKDLVSYAKPKLSEVLDSWKRVLHVGAPACTTELVFPLVFAVIMIMMASFGDEALAGMGVAGRIEMMAFIPILAINTTMGPFAGQNFGAKRMDRIHEAVALALKFVFIYGFGSALLLMALSGWLPTFFDPNPEVIRIARNYLIIVPLSYAIIGACFTMISVLNALGYPKPSMYLNIIRMLVFYLPLAWFLKGIWGPEGIFAATPLGFILMLIATRIWYKAIMGKLSAEPATADLEIEDAVMAKAED